MSTFKGRVKEFPDIRIDYFRLSSSDPRPSLANFLSHVHSDHLIGLESCKAPFIYCSSATRELLLRLEKYPHRMNFAKGILETRKQTYKHLKKLLKPIPLETPTDIELSPGNNIRVTLFDANHCIGSVMFLIEGQGHAILYTGDIRSEPWWVNALTRQPLLIPYAVPRQGVPLKRLDCIYLDTTFATKRDPYREFPSKAEGILDLLTQVSRYPKSTSYYFDSWTFGYEEVWLALSAFLGSRIHVDEYRYSLYKSVACAAAPGDTSAAKLMGFHCGNHVQHGCLTCTPARIHSCERGTGCDILDPDVVRITPIVSRHKGIELAELGTGGGHGDLNQHHELEIGDPRLVSKLMAFCSTKLSDQPRLLESLLEMLVKVMDNQVQHVRLDSSALAQFHAESATDHLAELDSMPLDRLIPALTELVERTKRSPKIWEEGLSSIVQNETQSNNKALPKRITFPYSRHSSYQELRHLIEAFLPRDIYPCTVDEVNWTKERSMHHMFADLYDNVPSFNHDNEMYAARRAPESTELTPSPGSSSMNQRLKSLEPNLQTAERVLGTTGHHHSANRIVNAHSPRSSGGQAHAGNTRLRDLNVPCVSDIAAEQMLSKDAKSKDPPSKDAPRKRSVPRWSPDPPRSILKRIKCGSEESDYGRLSPPPISRRAGNEDHGKRTETRDPRYRQVTGFGQDGAEDVKRRLALRHEAYDAVVGAGGMSWFDIGLVSVADHEVREVEL